MKFLLLLIGLSTTLNSFATQYWSEVTHSARLNSSLKTYQLDIDSFNTELSHLDNQPNVVIKLPRADGRFNLFKVEKTTVLAADLANKYPNLNTYKIQHTTEPDVRGRMELIDDKLSVMIKTGGSQELLNLSTDGANFQTYHVQNRSTEHKGTFSCGTAISQASNSLSMKLPSNHQYRTEPNTLKKLRVAIATTVEYSEEFCGTTATVLAEIAIALNRINEVYESELAITLELVSGNEDIIFLKTDSYDNDDANQMIDMNQTVIDGAIGQSNYDLGHVFSTGGGGLASIGAVCKNNDKASGVTGKSAPFNDAYWIDFVAHEMGHQLGAEHTFNGTSGSCRGNRAAGSAYEPGSGSTIMSYAGICSGENLQTHSDASFHFTSILEIDNELSQKGQSCGSSVSYSSIHPSSSNLNKPNANAGSNFNIPISTPFMLTGSATDGDIGDTLYYQWDGADQGNSTNAVTLGTDTGGVLFRSNLPQTNPERYFPSLFDLIIGSPHKGETLPTTSRDINFKLKVTDNKGGYDTDDVKLMSHSSIGAFAVTSQAAATSFTATESVLVSWDVANTTSAPVSCSNVEIQLLSISADNSTFCKETLSVNEINDGSALVALPNKNSDVSRFLIKCENNVFFALNDKNFSIVNGVDNASKTCFKTEVDGGLADSSFVSTATTCKAEPEPEPEPEPTAGGGFLSFSFVVMMTSLLLARRRV